MRLFQEIKTKGSQEVYFINFTLRQCILLLHYKKDISTSDKVVRSAYCQIAFFILIYLNIRLARMTEE